MTESQMAQPQPPQPEVTQPERSKTDQSPVYQHPPDNRGVHPIDIVPPPTFVLPPDQEYPKFTPDTPFWKPDLTDAIKHLGWRWIMFIPALGVLLAIVTLPMYGFTPVLFVGGGKLLIFCVGLAVTTAGTAVKSAMNERTDPFCIHCGYDLVGLPDHHNCPECGRPFSLQLVNEYRRDPAWFIQRYQGRNDRQFADAPFMAGPVRRKKSRDGT